MKAIKRHLAAIILFLFIVSCGTVPVTGRKQLSIVPTSTMLGMSFQQYDEFLKTNNVVESGAQARMVKRAGTRIQGAVETYFQQNGMSEEIKNYSWEFNLVKDDQVNAWCMPGGKVVVYTGILPITRDETGLAVVMGHEIAHAVAEHGNERMSQMLMVQLGGTALQVALSRYPEKTQAFWMQAVGLGAQIGVVLPYSRLHESEADRLGLIFMAMAGYDPQEADDFWMRMSEQSEGQRPPELLSTHPAPETRIRKIQEAMPEAMEYYQRYN